MVCEFLFVVDTLKEDMDVQPHIESEGTDWTKTSITSSLLWQSVLTYNTLEVKFG